MKISKELINKLVAETLKEQRYVTADEFERKTALHPNDPESLNDPSCDDLPELKEAVENMIAEALGNFMFELEQGLDTLNIPKNTRRGYDIETEDQMADHIETMIQDWIMSSIDCHRYILNMKRKAEYDNI